MHWTLLLRHHANQACIFHKLRLRSDNGSSYISAGLAESLEALPRQTLWPPRRGRRVGEHQLAIGS